MGITGLSHLIEGGQMQSEDIPQDEMTAEEAAAAQAAAPAEPAEPAEPNGGENGDENGDDDPAERTDEPAPVDNPDLPPDGDPDAFQSEPINPADMDQTSDEAGEGEDTPADLSEVEKEFDDDE